MVLDSAGYLKEVIYCGTSWEEDWNKCANLVNLHIAFLEDVHQCFKTDGDGPTKNICEVLSTRKYQIMCDDRFQEWARQIGHNREKLDVAQMKGEIGTLIGDIVAK